MTSDKDIAAMHLRSLSETVAAADRKWADFRQRLLDSLNPVQSFQGASVVCWAAASGAFQPIQGNTKRKGTYFWNDVHGGAGDACYLYFGNKAPTLDEFSRVLAPGASFSTFSDLPGYQGSIWAAYFTTVSGRLAVTDFV